MQARPLLFVVAVGVVAIAIAVAMRPSPARLVNEFALAPDGRWLAFTATDETGGRRLWVRSLADGGERALEGTGGASDPFWSGDSGAIAYVSEGTLRTVGASGGTSRPVTDAAPAAGAWQGDVILFSREHGGGPLYRVSAEGGAAMPATRLRDGDAAHASPAFLPDGLRFLYTALPHAGGEPAIHLGSLDSLDGREVLMNASRVGIADGYLVYLRDEALTVQLFDVDIVIPRGDPIRVGDGAPAAPGEQGVRAFSLSSAGLLAYQRRLAATAANAASPVTLVDWRTAKGR